MNETKSMVVRLPDDDGNLVTYESGRAIEAQLKIKSNRLPVWAKAGAVRSLDRPGGRYYSVLDVALIASETTAETNARGVKRIPAAYQASWDSVSEQLQRDSLPTARCDHEPWDEYDRSLVLDAFRGGAPVLEIAQAVERSYSAVVNVICQLRAAGDLPEKNTKPQGVLKLLALMTSDERAFYLTREREARQVAA